MESFESIVSKSYNFSRNHYDHDPKWKLLKELYDKNFLVSDGIERMPKKIHQIWLGSPIPKEYERLTDSWKKFNPDWEYKLWTDKDVGDVVIPRRKLFDSITHLGQKSDFLRYHILNQFGGLYADTDFECLKSFNSLSYAEFLIGVGYPCMVELYIGLIGCVPNHPIMMDVVRSMDKAGCKNWKEVFNTTGTYFFTKRFFEVIKSYTKGVVVLPTDYFYPVPNFERKNFKRDYITKDSYAVHHWAVAWRKKKGQHV